MNDSVYRAIDVYLMLSPPNPNTTLPRNMTGQFLMEIPTYTKYKSIKTLTKSKSSRNDKYEIDQRERAIVHT